MQVKVRYQVKLCRCSIKLNNANDIIRIALFLVERIVFFLVFRQQDITPFSHGVMYKFCHPRYNLSVVPSHQKYEFFIIIESTKIWKFVSNFRKEIEALDFKHLAASGLLHAIHRYTSHENAFCIVGPLWRESTCHRRILSQRNHNFELWGFVVSLKNLLNSEVAGDLDSHR